MLVVIGCGAAAVVVAGLAGAWAHVQRRMWRDSRCDRPVGR